MKVDELDHPAQPVVLDESGKAVGFKRNKIVRILLDIGKFNLDDIAKMDAQGLFGKGDYAQLAQLVGYSVSGYGESDSLEHPMQPIGWDGNVIRFKRNKIVQMLLDTGKFELNGISLMNARGMFGKGDYTQLMQLIGYSVSGYGELSTSPEEVVARADKIAAELVAAKGDV